MANLNNTQRRVYPGCSTAVPESLNENLDTVTAAVALSLCSLVLNILLFGLRFWSLPSKDQRSSDRLNMTEFSDHLNQVGE
jgi:hypothetical protein